jgi:putative transcriptional regulator
MDMGKNKTESPPPPNRIADLRAQRNWSQADLADRMGCTQETIRRYEKGERDINHAVMVELAAAFEVEPFEIIADKEFIIEREAAYIARHRKIISAYEALSESGKKAADHILFGERTAQPDAKKRHSA